MPNIERRDFLKLVGAGSVGVGAGFLLRESIKHPVERLIPHVVAPEDFAMLVRGQDRHGHFQLVPPPGDDLSTEAMAWHHRILAAQNAAMYNGASKYGASKDGAMPA